MKWVVLGLVLSMFFMIKEFNQKQKDLEYLVMESKYGNYISYSKIEEIADRHNININKELKDERN